jgi:hypothetical protein
MSSGQAPRLPSPERSCGQQPPEPQVARSQQQLQPAAGAGQARSEASPASSASPCSTRRPAGGGQLASRQRKQQRRQQAGDTDGSEPDSEPCMNDDCTEPAAAMPGVEHTAAAGGSQQQAHAGLPAGAGSQAGTARGSVCRQYRLPPWPGKQLPLTPSDVSHQVTMDGRCFSKLSLDEAFHLLPIYLKNPLCKNVRDFKRWLAGLRRAAKGGLPSHHPSLHFLPDDRQARVLPMTSSNIPRLSYNVGWLRLQGCDKCSVTIQHENISCSAAGVAA